MSYLLLCLAVIGTALLVAYKQPSKKMVSLLLAFSGAYLLSVTILHLLPEVYNDTSNATTVGIYILVGLLIQSVLESVSKGAEHGHIHHHSKTKKFPLLVFISLGIHAFSEGLPIAHGNDNLLWAIVIHKVPITIVLTSFLLLENFSKKTIVIAIGLFSIMSPLGMFVAEKLSYSSEVRTAIAALIIGVFLHISTIILFETSEHHKFNLQKFIAILLGIVVTIASL